jgi:phosphopantothenate-cysteine ligase
VRHYELYAEVQRTERMLCLEFSTLCEYLWHLRRAALAVAACGKRGLVYLAAAVADFYIPFDKMVEHKIQSDCGSLTLQLEPVPKMVYPLRRKWCPAAFVVTFKLETEEGLLETKCRKALKRYGQNLYLSVLWEWLN